MDDRELAMRLRARRRKTDVLEDAERIDVTQRSSFKLLEAVVRTSVSLDHLVDTPHREAWHLPQTFLIYPWMSPLAYKLFAEAGQDEDLAFVSARLRTQAAIKDNQSSAVVGWTMRTDHEVPFVGYDMGRHLACLKVLEDGRLLDSATITSLINVASPRTGQPRLDYFRTTGLVQTNPPAIWLKGGMHGGLWGFGLLDMLGGAIRPPVERFALFS